MPPRASWESRDSLKGSPRGPPVLLKAHRDTAAVRGEGAGPPTCLRKNQVDLGTPSLCGDAILFSEWGLGASPSIGLGEWGAFSVWGGAPFLVWDRRVPYLC